MKNKKEFIERIAEEISAAAQELICDHMNGESDLTEDEEMEIANEILALVAKKLTYAPHCESCGGGGCPECFKENV